MHGHGVHNGAWPELQSILLASLPHGSFVETGAKGGAHTIVPGDRVLQQALRVSSTVRTHGGQTLRSCREVHHPSASVPRQKLQSIALVLLPLGSYHIAACVGCILARCPFFRIPSNASNARIKQYWSHITPTAFLTTTACLQQLEAAGLLAIHTSEAPGICTVDLQYEPGGTQTEAHTSVLTVVVDAIPDLALPLPTQQNVSAAAITAAGSSPGSTGGAQHVLLSYASWMHRFRWQQKRYPLQPHDSLLVKTSPAFVDSVWETLMSAMCEATNLWGTGCKSVFMEHSVAALPSALVSAIATHQISHLLAVPQLLSAIVAAAAAAEVVDVQTTASRFQHPLHTHSSAVAQTTQQQQHQLHPVPRYSTRNSPQPQQDSEAFEHLSVRDSVSEGKPLTALSAALKIKQSPLRSLVYIASSGDVLPLQHVRNLQAFTAPGTVMLNIYGSAETTADCLVHEVQQVLPDTKHEASFPNTDATVTAAPQFVPLGNPLGCTEAYLLPCDDQNVLANDQQLAHKNPALKRKRDSELCSSNQQDAFPEASTGSDNASPGSVIQAREQHYRLMLRGACLAQGYLSEQPSSSSALSSGVIESTQELMQAEGFCRVSQQLLKGLQDRGLVVPPFTHHGEGASPGGKNTAEQSAACQTYGCQHSVNTADNLPSWCFVTRDIVSWSEGGEAGAGCCVFEGRSGSTVKVLGKQINLLSIEAAIQNCLPGYMETAAAALTHPVTHDTCIVVLISDASGPASHNETFHASSSSSNSHQISLQRLSAASEHNIRNHLSSFPEEYVQPAVLAQAAALPRLSSGKIDRLSISQLPDWQQLLSNSSKILNMTEDRDTRHLSLPQVSSAGENSELSIMQACMSVLAGSRAATALEPTTNLLEAGANSIQVAALAALLGCEPRAVFLHPSPRALQRALSAARQHEDIKSVPSSHGVRIVNPKERGIATTVRYSGPVPLPEQVTSVHESAGSAVPGTAVSAGSTKAVEFDNSRPAEHGCRDADSLKVVIRDSRGERAIHWIARHHLPVYSPPVGSLTTLDDQQQRSKGRVSHAWEEDSIIIDQMKACVDAPLTLIQQVVSPVGKLGTDQGSNENAVSSAAQLQHVAATSSCDDLAPSCKLQFTSQAHRKDKHAQWLLVCSHACDIACILLHSAPIPVSVHAAQEKVIDRGCGACSTPASDTPTSGTPALGTSSRIGSQRLWTASVGSSPDAGLQVTACGRCVVVACISGRLELLRLRTGEQLACVDTSGQLRRAPVLDPWFGCTWLQGHSKQLQAYSCHAPHESATTFCAHSDTAENSSCYQLKKVVEIHLNSLSSTLPRFCSVEQKRLLIVATMKPASVQAFQVLLPSNSGSSLHDDEASGEQKTHTHHGSSTLMNNSVYELQLAKLWGVAVEQPIFSSPAIVCCKGNESPACYVLFSTIQAEVCSLDASCGVVLWKTVLSGQVFVDLSVGFTCQLQPGDESYHTNWVRDTVQDSEQRCVGACVLIAANAPGDNVVLNVLNGSIMYSVKRCSDAVTSSTPYSMLQEDVFTGAFQHLNQVLSFDVSSKKKMGLPQWLVMYGDGVSQLVTAASAKQIDKYEISEGRQDGGAAFRCGVESFSGVLWLDRNTVLVGCRDNTVRLQKVCARVLQDV